MIEDEVYKVYKETDNRRHGHIKWEVSNYGNVKKNGEYYKPFLNRDVYGYYCFGSQGHVHRAVAELFIGDIPEGYQVDHIDGNRMNNRVDNLRICTQQENMNNPITRKRISVSKTGQSNGPFSKRGRKNMSISHIGMIFMTDGLSKPQKISQAKQDYYYKKGWYRCHKDGTHWN